MDKMSLVLDKKGIELSIEGKSLRIDTPGAPLQRVPLGMVGQVVVHGNPMAGAGVWRHLAEEGIPTVIFPGRGRGEAAWIGPGLSGGIQVRIAQFKAGLNPVLTTRACAWLLEKKLKGLEKLAKALERDTTPLQSALQRLDDADSPDSLRGIEGAAARQWFDAMGNLLPEKWQFSGRNRRPPRDPVNALLSLGYTLLFSEIRKTVLERGLDPCLGFLHAPHPGRDSLVLDLMEPFRPGVDAFALNLTDGILTPADFTTGAQEGCRLSKEGRSIFYQAWEEARETWPLFPESTSLATTARNLVNDFVRSWGIPEAGAEGADHG